MDEQIDSSRDNRLVELTAEVVAAYVSNNVVQTGDLSILISEVHNALGAMGGNGKAETPMNQKPAVNINKSLQDHQLTCLECGLKFKSLKRHLMTYHELTPEGYRSKWNLPSSYPMVAPAYAEKRSRLARDMKLGPKRDEE